MTESAGPFEVVVGHEAALARERHQPRALGFGSPGLADGIAVFRR